MATYYKWRKSTIKWVESDRSSSGQTTSYTNYIGISKTRPQAENGYYNFETTINTQDYDSRTTLDLEAGSYIGKNNQTKEFYGPIPSGSTLFIDPLTSSNGKYFIRITFPTNATIVSINANQGNFIEYVYSISSSAYPTAGVQGDYYYQKLSSTVTSPTAPANLQYPNPITSPTVTVSWNAATSEVPSYDISKYELSYALDGSTSWKIAGTTSGTSLDVAIPMGASSIQFRVRAQDSNNLWSTYTTGSSSPVVFTPVLTVPPLAMQGQEIVVNWTAVDTASSYTLQRKASTDAGWTQVYSGQALSFSEPAGAWTAVQYRVKATGEEADSAWATSGEIPVVSASALVISGQDGDLGTLVNDVPYSVSSDTGNQISLELRVNGALWTALEVSSGYAQSIPVIDLPTGAGTIDILATVQASTGAVSAARAWTYTKTPVTTSAGPCDVVEWQDATGAVKFPVTLAEAVRIPGGMTLDQVIQFPAQICTGSYVGTGTYGKDNPNTITLPFNAEIIWIGYAFNSTNAPTSAQRGAFSFMRGSSHGLSYIANQSSMSAIKISFEENTCSWFANTAIDQLNLADTTYRYVALGAFMDGDDE